MEWSGKALNTNATTTYQNYTGGLTCLSLSLFWPGFICRVDVQCLTLGGTQSRPRPSGHSKRGECSTYATRAPTSQKAHCRPAPPSQSQGGTLSWQATGSHLASRVNQESARPTGASKKVERSANNAPEQRPMPSSRKIQNAGRRTVVASHRVAPCEKNEACVSKAH